MIHLYSGDGKGKTSIAVGMTIRMAGSGGHVIFAQFMKGSDSSELNILKTLKNVEIIKVDHAFPFYNNMTDNDKTEITKCHNEILHNITEKIRHFDQDIKTNNTLFDTNSFHVADHKEYTSPKLMIVLDEITYPCRWNLVDESLLQNLINNIPDYAELVLTGRDPSDYMKERAHYWSEVKLHKHPYQQNVPARHGIEM